jgi:hypothetical protein
MQLQLPAAPGCHHRTYHGFCEDDGQHGSNFTCLISSVVSMGRRNTFLEFTRRSLKS